MTGNNMLSEKGKQTGGEIESSVLNDPQAH